MKRIITIHTPNEHIALLEQDDEITDIKRLDEWLPVWEPIEMLDDVTVDIEERN